MLARIVFISPSERKVFHKLSFPFQLHNSRNKNERKKKRNSKDELKNELVRSLVEVEVYENEEWAKRPDNVTNYEETIPVVKRI